MGVVTDKLDYLSGTKRLLREAINAVLADRGDPLLTESDPFEDYPSALWALSPAPSAGSLTGSVADKLLRLNETKARLREAINAELGIGLTESDPFRAYPDALWENYIGYALFGNNEQGAWYDPSDPTTLYQDAAGTTPVTADGDPVGLMLDKSGNDNHAPQSVSADRPQHRADGTMHRLAFDGAGDILLAPLGDITTPYVISYSLNPLDLTSPVRAFAGGAGVNIRILTIINTDGSIILGSRPENVDVISSTGLVSTNAPYILTFSRNSAGASIRLNGQVVATDYGAPDGTLTSSVGGEWGVGAQYYIGLTGEFSKCELSGLVVRHGADYTETQIHGLESYLAKRAGIML